MTVLSLIIPSTTEGTANLIQVLRSPRSEFAMKLRDLAQDIEAGTVSVVAVNYLGENRKISRINFDSNEPGRAA